MFSLKLERDSQATIEIHPVIWVAALSLFAMSDLSEPQPSALSAQTWAPKEAPLMTRWAKDVTPESVHPEYPRPQMVRKDWMNLNGLWDLAIKNKPGSRMGRPDFITKILVPFPVESALSGVMMRVDSNRILEYRRTFKVPAKWKGKRVLLHFGAVDWETTVFVNGKEVGTHRGGYDPFSFDITDFLVPDVSRKDAKAQSSAKGTGEVEQELMVRVWDPTDVGTQPRGKQVASPEGIWYTPTSGIWQTVWLEPVPAAYIDAIRLSSNLSAGKIVADVCIVYGANPGYILLAGGTIENGIATAKDGKLLTSLQAVGGILTHSLTFNLTKPKHWSPEQPDLYRLHFDLLGIPANSPPNVYWAQDTVDSYFAFRKISLGKDKQGRTRIFLNGKPYFLIGPLDQGFWPDGLYTAPSDAALKYDLEVTKKLGFNFIRKHVKVEPERFYYWCDKMGILVFQDMPSGDKYIGGNDPDITRTKESGEQFERELTAMVENLRNHPCIVGWVPYNEGWGQWDTKRITDLVKKLDPTRLVDSTSGWTDRGTGDLHDIHAYPGPGSPKPEPNRAAFLGEFGGLGLPLPGHMWKESGWGYRTYKTNEDLSDGIVGLFQNLRFLIDQPGLSGAVYTQTTDVETELNGFMTYDRAIIKPDPSRLKTAVRALFLPPPKVNVIVPTSEVTPQSWAYTTDKTSTTYKSYSWEHPFFDDSPWKRGPGGFGTEGTPGAVVRTVWNSSDIWLRRTIEIPLKPKPSSSNPKSKIQNLKSGSPHFRIHHDEDCEVYLGGKQIWSGKGYTTGYVLIPIPAHFLTPGKYTLAVHCHQTTGGQYIDVGIVQVVDNAPKSR